MGADGDQTQSLVGDIIYYERKDRTGAVTTAKKATEPGQKLRQEAKRRMLFTKSV